MIKGFDFSISLAFQISLFACLLFPVILLLVTKLPRFAGRNALQFLLSSLITSLIWLSILMISNNQSQFADLCASLFLYAGALLAYLEIWGLLSRGYTLGLLLTFYKSKSPLSVNEIAKRYRGGEGLDWLIHHRLGGLISAKMIHQHGNKITLTTQGCFIAYLYKISLLFFGLRYSG